MEVFIQGFTLARTVLDLRTDLFAHAQLYTALLRVSQRHQPLAAVPASPLRPKKTICITRRQFLGTNERKQSNLCSLQLSGCGIL